MSTLLIKNARYLIASTPFGILERGAVFIDGSRIVEVGPTAVLESKYTADTTIDADDKIVMPGLVDAHTHLGECHMFPLFGFLTAPLMGISDTLDKVVWPAYVWTPEEAVYDLEMLGFLNMLKTGTTTCADAFMYPDEAGRAAVDSGLRVDLGPTLITSIRLPDSKGPEDDLARTEAAIKKWHGAADGRVTYRVHASATYNCHKWFLKECINLARKYDVGFSTHLAESVDEAERARSVWPEGEVRRAFDLGLMGPKSIFFHSCILTEDEMRLYAETGTSAAHCPLTNSILGNVAWVPQLLAQGVTVGLGTDAPTNDLFNVMRIVSEIHTCMPRNPRGLLPWTPLELGTIGGARALSMGSEIGTLEPGKKADIITLDLKNNTRLVPLTPAILTMWLTLGTNGNDVADVIVDGKVLMRDKHVLHLDESKIIARAQYWTDEFLRFYLDKVGKGEPLVKQIHEEFQPD